MSVRWHWIVVMGIGTLASAVYADKLDKDAKKWLEQVRPILLPDEEKLYRDLSDKQERIEFQEIFWARRDPDIETPANEFRNEFEKVRADADQRFHGPGRVGSETDCGRVLILLGEPNGVKKQEMPEGAVGGRAPEVWTYRDRPGYTFRGGEIKIAFDTECRVPPGARFDEQLNRLAESRVVHPNIDYRHGPDGKLVKLADQLPKPTPSQSLLKQPRQDFPISAQTKLLMRGKDGAAYIAGLLRAESSGAAPGSTPIVVVVQALDEANKTIAVNEVETVVPVAADGSFVVSYGMALRPGKYTLRVGAVEPKANKGSVVTLPVEAPNMNTGELVPIDPIVLLDIREQPNPDPKDPMVAFQLGPNQLVPRFGNQFSTSESIQILSLVYDAPTDPTTGKAALTSRFTILKDGQAVTKGGDQTFDTPLAAPGVGPVPLAQFKPGTYVAQIKLTDAVGKKDYVKEVSFEVK